MQKKYIIMLFVLISFCLSAMEENVADAPYNYGVFQLRRNPHELLMRGIICGDEREAIRAIADGADVHSWRCKIPREIKTRWQTYSDSDDQRIGTPCLFCKGRATPLIHAARKGLVSVVAKLLECGAKPESGCPREECNILLLAQPKCMPMLLASGADVNARNAAGETLLIQAIKNVKYGRCQMLLKGHAQVNAHDGFGKTALHHAALHDWLGRAFCSVLLAGGADPFLEDSTGKIPIDYASPPTCALILNYMIQKNREEALRFLAKGNMLIGHILNDIESRHSVLTCTVEFGYYDACKLLLELEDDPCNVIGKLWLLNLAFYIHPEICKLLLQYDISDTSNGRASIVTAFGRVVHVSDPRMLEIGKLFWARYQTYLLAQNNFLPLGYQYCQNEELRHYLVGAIVIRNQSIITFLLCLSKHPVASIRELYRQKLFKPYLAPAYMRLKPVVEKFLGLDKSPNYRWPADPDNMIAVYQYYLKESREKFMEEEREEEAREQEQRASELLAAQRERMFADLGQEFESSEASVVVIPKAAQHNKRCVMQ